MLSTVSFVEKLLERDGPVWYRWNQDLPGLVEALKTSVRELSLAKPGTQSEISERATRQELLLWLLDRLLPESEGSLFEQHLNHARGIYAWARRLPPERRKEIIAFPLPAPSDHWNRNMAWQALIFGWCDSCPDDQLGSLLTELQPWFDKLEPSEGWYLREPIEEFCRRCTDKQLREKELSSLLQRSLKRSQEALGVTSKFADEIASSSWVRLLRETALAHPSADPLPNSEEHWEQYFTETMALPEFSRVAELGRELVSAGARLSSNSKSLWIWRHGRDEWGKLYSPGGIFLSDFWNSGAFLDRFVEVVPTERLDIWDGFVISESRFERIHAFCRWLPAPFAEVLRDHFNHPDRDWAACAYQNYLAKTPEPILQHWFKLFDDLPGWQLALLDRRLFAPEPVRPAPLLEDIQTVEGDLRLQDPFNHRGY